MFDFIDWNIFDNLNIKETFNLFSKTSYIIGVQGAGLTNMLFAPNDITVIEIAPINFPNLCYNHMSQMLGNKHYTYTIEDNRERNVCQINIDLEDFYYNFEKIII
jgi:capsular polysaccharide biosynthesis protein